MSAQAKQVIFSIVTSIMLLIFGLTTHLILVDSSVLLALATMMLVLSSTAAFKLRKNQSEDTLDMGYHRAVVGEE